MTIQITLVIGGAKSGKSTFALNRLLAHSGPKYFLATSPKCDEEMERRIEAHIEERVGKGIITLEEEVDILSQLKKVPKGSKVILDCLTLWVNNLLFKAPHLTLNDLTEIFKREFQKDQFQFEELIIVTNEVGLGLVPLEKVSRHYRDLLGKANQLAGELSSEAYFLSAGIPLKLK